MEKIYSEISNSIKNSFCPNCKSVDVKRKTFVPVSIYGHLPKNSVDVCMSCGFKSEDSFFAINRNNLIEIVINKNGIQ